MRVFNKLRQDTDCTTMPLWKLCSYAVCSNIINILKACVCSMSFLCSNIQFLLSVLMLFIIWSNVVYYVSQYCIFSAPLFSVSQYCIFSALLFSMSQYCVFSALIFSICHNIVYSQPYYFQLCVIILSVSYRQFCVLMSIMSQYCLLCILLFFGLFCVLILSILCPNVVYSMS